jgi:hypothetical protein
MTVPAPIRLKLDMESRGDQKMILVDVEIIRSKVKVI